MKLDILGSPANRQWEAVIVIQGAYSPETKTVILEFLSRNPNVLIICSTYPSARDSISDGEKALVEAGLLVFLFVTEPPQDLWPYFWETNHANQNLQRLSSYVGLEYARMLGIEFSLKIRSDTFLGKKEVIRYFKEQLETYPAQTQIAPSEVKSRIVVSGQGTITTPGFWAPFHVRDHWYFGHTEDLVKFFDISSESSWADGTGVAISCPESAMTCVWMKDLGITAIDTRDLLARYFIIEDAAEIEQVRLTQTQYWTLDYHKYKSEGIPYLRQVYATADSPGNVTTRDEWLKML